MDIPKAIIISTIIASVSYVAVNLHESHLVIGTEATRGMAIVVNKITGAVKGCSISASLVICDTD